MRTNHVTPARMEAVRKLIEDGASQTEITRTTGMARETIIRHFPGAGWTKEAGWTSAEIGSYARAIRTAKHKGLL